YGRADKAAAQNYVDGELEKLANDGDAVQAFKRQNPVVEEDVWREGGGDGSTFDNLRLSYRKEKLADDELMGLNPYVECNLRWTGERLNSQVTIDIVTTEDKLKGKVGHWRIHNIQWLKK